ncbi:hypothetical protein [Francisella philomiragia]|uniref:hypothetical protein n=1 Tax=Francisella philomiragia TaxID=28110 RepID=UPI0019050B6E|nr:hypothetical protein [Francisella philomiragia]MBK2270202.1 hypothetical protein [Francisella philomiragia]MBK2275866.1 hypothetical protein [Francisella philomiragia]MBK2305079.1 hypothetical protein [Francisella philomiragia]
MNLYNLMKIFWQMIIGIFMILSILFSLSLMYLAPFGLIFDSNAKITFRIIDVVIGVIFLIISGGILFDRKTIKGNFYTKEEAGLISLICLVVGISLLLVVYASIHLKI